jgi:hypothetical protein
MSTQLLATIFQLLDQAFNFPTGFDVIVACLEDYYEAYKFIQSLKMV